VGRSWLVDDACHVVGGLEGPLDKGINLTQEDTVPLAMASQSLCLLMPPRRARLPRETWGTLPLYHSAPHGDGGLAHEK
jgi:hypothetical protein